MAPTAAHPTTAAMIAVDHIASAIVSHATRPTLATLMRVNRRFYDVASKTLYATVAVYEDTVASLLYPIVAKKTGPTKTHDAKIRTLKPMQRKINKKKGKGMGAATAGDVKETGNAKEDGPGVDARDATTDKNMNKSETSKNKTNKTNANKNKTNETNNRTNETNNNKTNNNKNKNEANSNKTANNNNNKNNNHNPPKSHASGRAPKSALLGHIRTLTIGSHPKWVCDAYASALASHATNIDTVRVVQFPLHMYATHPLCEHALCRFLAPLSPRKLVVRNCSGDAVPFPAMWKMPASVDEVVLVLSTIRDRYAGGEGKGPLDLAHSLPAQFSTARDIKIIFWPDWDLSIGRDRALVDPTIVDRTQLIFVDDITRVLKYATYHPGGFANRKPDVTIYGFANLKLTDLDGHSGFVRKYNAEHPTPGEPYALPRGGLHMITKRHLERLEVIMWAPPGGSTTPQVLGCAMVRFKTLEGYVRNKSARVGEISEWD